MTTTHTRTSGKHTQPDAETPTPTHTHLSDTPSFLFTPSTSSRGVSPTAQPSSAPQNSMGRSRADFSHALYTARPARVWWLAVVVEIQHARVLFVMKTIVYGLRPATPPIHTAAYPPTSPHAVTSTARFCNAALLLLVQVVPAKSARAATSLTRPKNSASKPSLLVLWDDTCGSASETAAERRRERAGKGRR